MQDADDIDPNWLASAKAVGVTDAQIEALDGGGTNADCFDEVERLVLRFTGEVVRDPGASEAIVSALTKHLSHREIVELILAIGFYMLVARLMVTAGIDLEPAQGTAIFDRARQESTDRQRGDRP